ncbi:competence type IV pilus minor pilin ComGD [Marinilactibacillus sp. GCM10026970]|uniref:competence type IV pilus minor pilin ComGD n=1 Tax=Marinilactibacillus sp. GCM10026970 TaxID=3252642 RepID=UPI00362124A5
MIVAQDQKGFTLVETLVVLSLIWIFLLIPVIPFQSIQEETETKQFFKELESTITLIQNHAILNGETTRFETRPDAKEIAFRVVTDRNHPLNENLKIPEHIELVSASRVYRFVSDSGNQGNLNPIRFKTDNQLIVIQFSLGSGRFDVKTTSQ